MWPTGVCGSLSPIAASGSSRRAGKPGDLCAILPTRVAAQCKRGHITRTSFLQGTAANVVSCRIASNDGEGMGKRGCRRDRAYGKRRLGLGSAWGNRDDRAAVLVSTRGQESANVFALAGCETALGSPWHPQTGDLLCSTNERDDLGDDLVPGLHYAVRDGRFLRLALVLSGRQRRSRHRGERPDL